MDPITDIYKTMHVAAVVHSKVEATAPWGLTHQATNAGQAELARHPSNTNVTSGGAGPD